MDGFNQFANHLLNFVLTNKSLLKLNLTPFIGEIDDLTLDDLVTIVSALPKITELVFCADGMDSRELVAFLKHKMLKKVQLLFVDPPDILPELETEWIINMKSVNSGFPRFPCVLYYIL